MYLRADLPFTITERKGGRKKGNILKYYIHTFEINTFEEDINDQNLFWRDRKTE